MEAPWRWQGPRPPPSLPPESNDQLPGPLPELLEPGWSRAHTRFFADYLASWEAETDT